MNTKPSSNKTTISVIAAIVIAAIAYFYYTGSTATSTSLVASTNNAAVGSQVLDLLNQIQSLNIDASIFSDPGYKTLRDYSVPIPTVDVGRPNPFAPLPGFSTTGTSGSGQTTH